MGYRGTPLTARAKAACGTEERAAAEDSGEVANEVCVPLLVPKEAQYRDGRDVVDLKKDERNGFVRLRVESIGA